jgi:small-conductance mechanosensitive channel
MALGSKTLVSNLIGSYFLQQQYQPGQLARMGEVQGTILEITPTSVILNTEEGRMIVPAKVFNDECTLLVVQGETDE